MSILELTPRCAPVVSLTPRELVVLASLSPDITLEEIAAKLWVSRNTVKTQLHSMYRKIGVSTKADAIAWAVAAGLR